MWKFLKFSKVFICFSIIPIIKADSIIELQIKINVKYETPKIIEVLSGDGTKTGDEIRIGKEHFYVISNDGTNATLLAKYNLEVGHDCIYNSQYVCTPIENASGIQSSKARGLVPSEDFTEVISNYGSVTFNNGKIYVDNYKTYIEKLGIVINSARLIEYEELVALGCSASNRTCTTSDHEWLYTTTYWTSSILGGGYIYIVTCNGGIDSNSESNDVVAGVRPVIVIPSSSI